MPLKPFFTSTYHRGTDAVYDADGTFVDPRGTFLEMGPEDKTELVVAEMDLDMIEEVRRVWQFYRDRRPDSDGSMAGQLP